MQLFLVFFSFLTIAKFTVKDNLLIARYSTIIIFLYKCDISQKNGESLRLLRFRLIRVVKAPQLYRCRRENREILKCITAYKVYYMGIIIYYSLYIVMYTYLLHIYKCMGKIEISFTADLRS